MDPTRQTSIPEEETIEELLGRFRPHPTQRFYKRMSTAPWTAESRARKLSSSISPVYSRKAIAGLLALIALIALLTTLYFPSARVAAEQIIHFFLPAHSDQLEVQITPASPTTILDFSNPANFTLDIRDAQNQAKFGVREISNLPAYLIFIGARFEPSYNAVIFLYSCEDYNLYFTQRPSASGQDVFSIGESASIEIVDVGNVRGEYVLGGWKTLPGNPPSTSEPTEDAFNLNAIWDNQLAQSTLRWQSSSMVYELRTSGEQIPQQSELIEWANGLK